MPMSAYMSWLREHVGDARVLLPVVVAVIRDANDRVLFQRKSEGIWNLPGGAIDPGETPAEAMRREVWEETGLEVEPRRIIAVTGGTRYRWTYPNGHQIEPTLIVFECEVCGGALDPRDEETAELGYFDRMSAPKLPALPFPQTLIWSRDSAPWFD